MAPKALCAVERLKMLASAADRIPTSGCGHKRKILMSDVLSMTGYAISQGETDLGLVTV